MRMYKIYMFTSLESHTHRPFAFRSIGKTLKANAASKFCQRAFQPVLLQRTNRKTLHQNKRYYKNGQLVINRTLSGTQHTAMSLC